MARSKGARKSKSKKDPLKPKRGMSSFMFFANDKRAEVRTANPSLKITEVGRKLGEMWKELTPEEKKKYEDLSSKDSERYQEAMKGYTKPESDSDSSDDDSSKKKRKKNKEKKDPNRPKRAMSSFMFFANEKRAEVKAKYPDLKVTEIGKKLAELWKELDADEKKKYSDIADSDRERYRNAISTYNPNTSVAASSSSSESSSDSDDD
eukprot:TRINITY_DN4056_c0_g1_i1.p1 TRINITY_DN4056_c0_g1~~TRINITY_DN4056_c0_g1_i1.p1  ORF type:complete len:207 (+),score=87.30 TRINITY_DN4056_c0_g1_i1:111-731(+)